MKFLNLSLVLIGVGGSILTGIFSGVFSKAVAATPPFPNAKYSLDLNLTRMGEKICGNKLQVSNGKPVVWCKSSYDGLPFRVVVIARQTSPKHLFVSAQLQRFNEKTGKFELQHNLKVSTGFKEKAEISHIDEQGNRVLSFSAIPHLRDQRNE